MKPTETQKNFRKQMENVKNEQDIYDTTRKGNPFLNNKNENSTFTYLLSIGLTVFIFFIVLKISHYFKNQTVISQNPEKMSVSNIAQTPIASQSSPTIKAVTQEDSSALSQLETIRKNIQEDVKKLSEQHNMPWQNRDITTYKLVLTNGIITCNNQSQKIATISTSPTFKPLVDSTNDYINNSSNAYKYYLNYVNSHNPSDIDIANQYLTLANQNAQGYLNTFIQILHDNNYNYSVTNNQVNYSVLIH